MITTVKFAKIKDNAIIPTKREEDAGFDIYPCFDDDYIAIAPHTTELIPTGIASACDKDYCFILKERGSTGSIGIAQRCGVIDSGYRNEWFVPITNTTDNHIVIVKDKITDVVLESNFHLVEVGTIYYPYKKAIAQALLIPVPTVDVEEYTYEELQAINSKRGNGCLGSSGK